jgi:hypothetical protein
MPPQLPFAFLKYQAEVSLVGIRRVLWSFTEKPGFPFKADQDAQSIFTMPNTCGLLPVRRVIQKETAMKVAIAIATLLITYVGVQSASAATVSQREYSRGYKDCSKGRYDKARHGASYKKGCRAAEDKMAKKKPTKAVCPVDVAQADRYKYPACK